MFGGEKCCGNDESEDIPSAVLPDRSALVRSDDRMEPVCGQSTVNEPPPPLGVIAFEGLVVETQTTAFEGGMTQAELSFVKGELVFVSLKCFSFRTFSFDIFLGSPSVFCLSVPHELFLSPTSRAKKKTRLSPSFTKNY